MTMLLGLCPLLSGAADLNVQLKNAPSGGSLVFQVYDAADTFADFRDPAKEIVLAARGDGEYRLADIYVQEEQAIMILNNFSRVVSITLTRVSAGAAQ